MFSLTIVFGPGPMVWTLMFKDREKAVAAVNDESLKPLADLLDMHRRFWANRNGRQARRQIHGYMLENLDQSKFAHIEHALHQKRTKIAGDKLAEADPTIREAARRERNGLPMMQPMNPGLMTPNGGFRG